MVNSKFFIRTTITNKECKNLVSQLQLQQKYNTSRKTSFIYYLFLKSGQKYQSEKKKTEFLKKEFSPSLK